MSSLFDLSTGWSAAGHWTCVHGPLPGWLWIAVLLFAPALILYPASAFGSGERGGKVRAPILAGSWYEGDPAALADSVSVYLRGEERPDVPVPVGAKEARAWAASGRYPVAVIVPHAGHVYSGDCAGETFNLLKGSSYKRVILMGPSHQMGFAGGALPEEDAFSTPLGTIPLDRDAIRQLAGKPGFQVLPRAHANEHSLEIELPFLQEVLPAGFTLVPVVVGRVDGELVHSMGSAVAALWDSETLVVVSSDFTHYGSRFGYVPFTKDVPDNLRKLDGGASERILAEDRRSFEAYLDSTGATICGREPIRVLLEALSGRNLSARVIEYYRSGDKVGDFHDTVSYTGIAFFAPWKAKTDADPAPPPQGVASADTVVSKPRPLSKDEQDYLLKLARQTVTALVLHRKLPSNDPPRGTSSDSPLLEERGVFVTLMTGHGNELRGCIGNIIGDEPLILGVLHNAVNAACRDPRFIPVAEDELDSLHLEISVLTPLEKVNGPEDIVIGRHGVVLEKHGRRAVFLPQVAPEQGWDRTEMLRHLAKKAGLSPEDWRSGTTFYTFEAQVFEEEEAGGDRR
jgi:AmmeMemoRadiSam system protein B/AmmeMemoRadiSam system protein A